MENNQTGQKVILSITGIQKYDDFDNSIEVVAPGKYYIKDNKQYLAYKERNEGASQDILTTVKIEHDKISVMRFGGINTNMTFELNKKHTTFYDTEHGALTVSVTAKKIRVELDEEEAKGEIEVVYEFEIDHMLIGINILYIKMHPTSENENNASCEDLSLDDAFLNDYLQEK